MRIEEYFSKYIDLYPTEINELQLLAEQLDQADQDIISRKNFVGHVTSSAFIINRHTRQVLLLEHKSLGKLLQPGGHIDEEDPSLLAATLREVEEETGISADDLTLRPVLSTDQNVPFDIDTHHIPENPRKEEPAHYHHDFRYLYLTDITDIAIDKDESSSYRWIDWEKFAENPRFTKIADRIEGLLEPNPRDFFRSLVGNRGSDISVVAVSHIIPSSEAYLSSLHENFNLIGVIPKPKSINDASRSLLEKQGVTILDQFSRENITSDPKPFAAFLAKYDDICLVDIGGYFSESAEDLKKLLGKKLLGIVEDTENGHQKYEKIAPENVQIMSVARSPLKNYEDQLVGEGVAHAAETVLRELNALITYKVCGIIGYGKIGRGIARYLQSRGIRPLVCEIEPTRAIQAACDGMQVTNMNVLLKRSELVFCATGARAIDILGFRDLRRGAFLASVTSSDDEFDLRFIDSEYSKQEVAAHITKYTKRGHSFFLLNDGNAINFLYSAAVDTYIYLVQGELVISVLKMAESKNRKKFSENIVVNSDSDRQKVAQSWLDHILRNDLV